jgi:hypothetical protein
MNIEFGQPASERSLSCEVAGNGAVRREAHYRQFIFGLYAACVVEDIDSRRRIGAINTERECIVIEFAYGDALVAIFGQVRCNLVRRMYDANVEMISPIATGFAWHNVPVVARLVVDENWLLAGRVDDVGKWQLRQRGPAYEVRIGLERVMVVVEKCQFGIA